MELAFRLLIALFVVLAPTVLFLGLWHGLHALRDDRLIERMEQMQAQSGDSNQNEQAALHPATVLTGGETGTAKQRQPNHVDCGTCGTPNPHEVTFCHECLGRLS